MRLRIFASATLLLMSAAGAAVPVATAAPATPGLQAGQEAAQEASEIAEEAAEEAAESAEEATISSEEAAAAGPGDASARASRPGAKNRHRHIYSGRIKRLRRMIARIREQKKVVRALPHTDIRWLVHLPNKRRRIIEYHEKIQELRLRAQEVRSRS